MSVRSAARLSPLVEARPVSATVPVDLARKRRSDARRRRLMVSGGRLVLGVVIVAGWEFGARAGVIDKFFWSQPSDIGATLWRWITEGTDLGPLWEQVLVTMEETVGGFVVGSVFGVVFGVILGSNRLLADILGPYIKGANAIPRVVVGALFAVSLGLDIQSKIATASVLVFFVVFFNAFQGVREVDRNLIANARILGADNRHLTTEIVIPSALSWIVASLHTSFGLALVGAVVGELFGAYQGVGELIYESKNLFDTSGVFAGMLLLASIALIAEALITVLENRLIRWRPPVATETRI
ncbi:MAG: ABC transporter permease [Actinobacteria bacterium 13_2_20CM_2_66_6]|nr:MAG: ABC transporter permease [Actinobacteria bacterium 13_2_20CM_2_66_6]